MNYVQVAQGDYDTIPMEYAPHFEELVIQEFFRNEHFLIVAFGSTITTDFAIAENEICVSYHEEVIMEELSTFDDFRESGEDGQTEWLQEEERIRRDAWAEDVGRALNKYSIFHQSFDFGFMRNVPVREVW